MASDLNTRLAAILDKHPQLRPTGSDEPPYELKLFLHHGGLWCYSPSQEQLNADGYIDDDCAEALIFRAMVENLPDSAILMTPQWELPWRVYDGGIDKDFTGDAALDALVNFYEGKDTP